MGDPRTGGPSYGERIVRALVPRFYKDVRALERACGISYQTLHAWKTGAEPRMSELHKISAALGFDVVELLSPKSARAPKGHIGEHRDWSGAVAEAKRQRPGRMPDYAYTFAAHTSGAKAPAHITWQDAYALADWWMNTIGDEELMRAETEQAQREMDEEDAAIERDLRERTPSPANEAPTNPPSTAKRGATKKGARRG